MSHTQPNTKGETMVKIEATVRRFNHNRELVSIRVVDAEPHVMRFIGDGGRQLYGEEIQETFNELMEYGYQWTVQTVFEEASMMEFAC